MSTIDTESPCRLAGTSLCDRGWNLLGHVHGDVHIANRHGGRLHINDLERGQQVKRGGAVSDSPSKGGMQYADYSDVTFRAIHGHYQDKMAEPPPGRVTVLVLYRTGILTANR